MEEGKILSAVLGYPRIGEGRELKKATEKYWKGEMDKYELIQAGRNIRRDNWLKQKQAGIDIIPSNDFSFYDQVLDMTCLLGNIPARFKWDGSLCSVEMVSLIARGRGVGTDISARAGEMTKWFDTNYHYIVPEFHRGCEFRISSRKVFDEFDEAMNMGIRTRPVLIGPVTYLALGKEDDDSGAGFTRFSLLPKLLPVYAEILNRLHASGAQWVQIDEPVGSLDLAPEQQALLRETYDYLAEHAAGIKIMLTNYFGALRENKGVYLGLPVAGLHVDALRGTSDLPSLIEGFPKGKMLSLGIVDGRNIWRNEYEKSLGVIYQAKRHVDPQRLIIATSCSLLHSPITVKNETQIDPELKSWLSFADEKLLEVAALAAIASNKDRDDEFYANQAAAQSRKVSRRIHDQAVGERLASITPNDTKRKSVFAERQERQRQKLSLPELPTTTIGSFPQTPQVRQKRAQLKKGEMTLQAYESFIKEEIEKAIRLQEDIGLDMLVHGEFERNDMVEYFGEMLNGFAFTGHGWVQSYGSRYVKPPVIFGDVSRPAPMTVAWSKYAQSLTSKPVKGMLTGPVTIAQWSFVRDDQPRETTVKQIALAIRDEVQDLEAAGIGAIQIDEPAIREGLPLRKSDWPFYLQWAVDAFRLSCGGVADETQIHTHMCYAEFNDIIEAIAALDADVISIETSRSNMELLEAFVRFQYPNEIGPGVYDIHSPSIS